MARALVFGEKSWVMEKRSSQSAERPQFRLHPSLPKELLVEQEDEEIDVDFGFVKEFHDSHTLILQLQEVLVVELKLLHVHTQELGIDEKPSCLVSRSDVKDDVSEVRNREIFNFHQDALF